ncbi:MAG: nitroreductase family protein [Sedimentisphaerales bacterium]|nr:nitroreductase family protein [Sedimentisphaerales bacterium]
MLKDLMAKNRSYRRFDQNCKIKKETLMELVGLARLSPSGANLQPLKYYLSCDEKTNALIFEQLGWAGYLKDWPGSEEGERPGAYIVILGDTNITKNFGCDYGIAAQSILLGAVEKGLGGCMLATIKKKELARLLNLDSKYEILLVVALGKPKEKVVIEDVGQDGNIKYWRDENNTHHVPKRKLEDLIVS